MKNLAVINVVVEFAFGFFSIMIISTIIALITMLLYRPQSWCVYYTIGTMTEDICIIKK
ncbi:hypothetical protein [Clostridium septicum]|uniref:hypothetical protein n=1 Tax=Clostridium septicum TaxID=1504 RepID=UPI0013C3EA6E